jgi:hypothetical protein
MSFIVTVTPVVQEVEVNATATPYVIEVVANSDLKKYAEEAKESADDAEESALEASQSASNALSSANSASASALSASGSASSASASASTATTQANIATTKANEASQSASDAIASETAAAISEGNALASEQAASTSEGLALISEQNALASEQAAALSASNALSSANSASASASTATTQAGIATTQAGIATTQAGNALTSANNAAASASAAAQVGTSTLLTGFSVGANTSILATDSILTAFNKTQGQINARISGTIASGQVAFGTGVNTVGGDSGLTWDNSNKTLDIGAGGVARKLFIRSSGSLGSNYIDFVNSTGRQGYFGYGNSSDDDLVILQNKNSPIRFATNAVIRWTILGSGVFQSNGAQTIQTSTGLLSLQANGGNVGINTTTDAGFRLDVNGTARVQGDLTTNLTATRIPFIGTGGVLSDDAGLSWDNTGKFVTLTRTSAGVATNPLLLVNNNTADNTSVGIRFAPTTNFTIRYAEIVGVNESNNQIGLSFVTAQGATITEKWRIRPDGILQSEGAQTIRTTTGNLTLATAGGNGNILLTPNGSGFVGVNTTAPTRVLDVNGIARFRSFIGIDNSDESSRSLFFTNGDNLGNIASGRIRANGLSVFGGGTEHFRLFANSGNLLLQNGGTFTDVGFRLDVNGSTRLNGLQTFQGTTASDTAPLGSELTTTGSGTNWTGTGFATGYTHVVGSTAPLTTSTPAVSGTYYQIAYTVTGRTAGSFTIGFGGFLSGNLTATGATGPLASSTANLEIVPTTDFDGTIVLSIRSIGVSSATTAFNDSNGVARIQIRANTSSNNTLVGASAGRRVTTGTSNSFFGASSGLNNTTGQNNSFFGSGSGQSNVNSNNNSFFGWSSGISNTTGAGNSFFGSNAGGNNTVGNSNSFVGVNAGALNTTGSNNSFFGLNAGINNLTGNNNLFLGVNSGRRTSGSANLTTASNSVFLGNDTRANADSETNQIVVGASAIGLGSNTSVIGNASTTHGRWWGNLLIGTSTNVASSALTVDSTTKGFLPPRMTTAQRDAIASPATGLIVYNTSTNKHQGFNGTAWNDFY